MKNARYINVFLVACLLTSCSYFKTEDKAPPLRSPEQYESRVLSDAGLEKFAKEHYPDHKWPSRIWNIDTLSVAALYFNPTLKVAYSKLDEAIAAEKTAGQIPNPTLSIAPTRDTTTMPVDHLLALNLNIPVETNGKRSIRENAAYHNILSNQWQLESAMWDVRRDLMSAMIDYRSASLASAKYNQLLKSQKEISDIYDRRNSEGQLPTLAATQANIIYQQNIAAAATIESSMKQARVRMAASIGIPVKALDDIEIDYDLFKNNGAYDMRALRKRALENNPAIQSAMQDYLAAHENLRLEVAKRIPDLDIGPGYEWNSNAGGKFSIGLAVVLPVFNNNEGPIAEAKAKRQTTAHNFELVQANIISSIEQAEAAYNSTRNALENISRAEKKHRKKLDQIRSVLGDNMIAQLPLLYNSNELLTSEISRIDVETQMLKARAALEDAMRIGLAGTEGNHAE